MKRSALVRLVFVCLVVTAIRNAGAGSAVATDGHGHTVHSFGHAKTSRNPASAGNSSTLWLDGCQDCSRHRYNRVWSYCRL
jgi:hypothetical protein